MRGRTERYITSPVPYQPGLRSSLKPLYKWIIFWFAAVGWTHDLSLLHWALAASSKWFSAFWRFQDQTTHQLVIKKINKLIYNENQSIVAALLGKKWRWHKLRFIPVMIQMEKYHKVACLRQRLYKESKPFWNDFIFQLFIKRHYAKKINSNDNNIIIENIFWALATWCRWWKEACSSPWLALCWSCWFQLVESWED